MSGVEDYENRFRNKINVLIENNKDLEFLESFYYFFTKQSITTIFSYMNIVVSFMRYIKKKDPTKVMFDDYTKYMFYVRKYTSSYQITVYAALKKFSTYLQASGRCKENPMSFIDRPKKVDSAKTIQKRENGYLNTEEIEEYISSVEDSIGATSKQVTMRKEWKSRDVLIVLMLLNTGMRCSAMYKLDINDVNLDNMTITTTDKEDKVNVYAISPDLVPYIKDWLEYRTQVTHDHLKHYRAKNALFISRLGYRMTPQSISNVVTKYSVNIKGKHITPHKLRATYGTQLYNKTKDLVFVQEAMHHNNPKTTELYIRGNADTNRDKAADIMASITRKNNT